VGLDFSRPISEWKMSHSKRALAVLLLLIIGSATTSHLIGYVSAQPDEVVRMSPGTYAGTLGASEGTVKLDQAKGAIVQNTTGDISLSINVKQNSNQSIAIYIPPEFTFQQSDTTSVWTSITNDYRRISVTKLSSRDAIAPSW